MASKANIGGHPIHPMIVPMAIGLFVFSFICDLIQIGSGDPVWSTLALYTMGGGIIGALCAAVFGFIDLISLSPSRAKTIGIWHMVINLTIVVLFAVDFWIRIGGMETGPRVPFILSLIAIILLVVSGWLGGEMVYVHGVAQAPEHRGSDVDARTRERARTTAHEVR
jgi:uncharacterized membrane protein